uniref:competence type IV pilus minor pilin ComGD n=1 Tax=Candidatus Enterococcus willemsii TaxID=1857215 RepID=UPI00403FA11C
MKHRLQGFTILESLIVLVIVSMFLLLPMIASRETSKTMTTLYFLDRLEKNMLVCQQTAIVENRQTKVLQNADNPRELAFRLAPGIWLESLVVPETLTVSSVPIITFAGGTGNAQSFQAFSFIWNEKGQKITYRFLFGKGHFEKKISDL